MKKQTRWSIAKTADREARVNAAIERLGFKGITALLDWLLEMGAEAWLENQDRRVKSC